MKEIEDDENNEDKIKALKDNNLIYEEDKNNNLNNKNQEIEGYDEYLILKEKINVIINLIKKKGLSNNNIYSNNDLDMDLYKSKLDFNYAGFYCFMVKENLWKKYFKFTDLNTIIHTDDISKNNKMSITSIFFQAKEEKNIAKKNGIPYETLNDLFKNFGKTMKGFEEEECNNHLKTLKDIIIPVTQIYPYKLKENKVNLDEMSKAKKNTENLKKK